MNISITTSSKQDYIINLASELYNTYYPLVPLTPEEFLTKKVNDYIESFIAQERTQFRSEAISKINELPDEDIVKLKIDINAKVEAAKLSEIEKNEKGGKDQGNIKVK